ncbi:restriction endonuclease subunit S [Maribacter litoralis]|uniref:restriction endonuclease subunit S n=1 Tax=Maribacter litoralis TaxID=2059726 RepID=UPI003F5CF8DE
MKSNYKRLGDYIEPCVEKNTGNLIKDLRGISNRKYFQKAKTNTIGIDLSKYIVVRTNQFAFNRATTRNGDKISIALRKGKDCIVSPSYRMFKSRDENILNSEYLMMWFRRPEFDRYARFKSHGSAHEFFDLDEMYEVELPVPSIEKQREIVKEYNTVVNRIKLNEKLNQKLEDAAQALYKHWFVDFEFPNAEGKPYKSTGGKMVYNEELDLEIPEGWKVKSVKEFSVDMKSGATPNRGVPEYWNSHDIPWLKTGELKNGVIINSEEYISELGLKESSAKILPKNSVLIAMYGQGETKGQVGYLKIESSTNQACCAIISLNEICATFLYYHLRLNRKEIVSVAIGGAQPNLSKEIIENIKLLIPKKEVLENHPFVYIMNYRESLTRENYYLSGFKNIILSKMSKTAL